MSSTRIHCQIDNRTEFSFALAFFQVSVHAVAQAVNSFSTWPDELQHSFGTSDEYLLTIMKAEALIVFCEKYFFARIVSIRTNSKFRYLKVVWSNRWLVFEKPKLTFVLFVESVLKSVIFGLGLFSAASLTRLSLMKVVLLKTFGRMLEIHGDIYSLLPGVSMQEQGWHDSHFSCKIVQLVMAKSKPFSLGLSSEAFSVKTAPSLRAVVKTEDRLTKPFICCQLVSNGRKKWLVTRILTSMPCWILE